MRVASIWAVTAFVSVTAQRISNNGRCGPEHGGRICKGSEFGDCCSQYGWCGRTKDHCGTGCNPNVGSCSATPSPSPTKSVSPTNKVSKDARCGSAYGATGGYNCLGSIWGDCCSQYSYCGSTSAYCSTGCQPGFGACKDEHSSVQRLSTSKTSTLRTIASTLSTKASSRPTPSSIVTNSDGKESSTSKASTSSKSPTSSALLSFSSTPDLMPTPTLSDVLSSSVMSSPTPMSTSDVTPSLSLILTPSSILPLSTDVASSSVTSVPSSTIIVSDVSLTSSYNSPSSSSTSSLLPPTATDSPSMSPVSSDMSSTLVPTSTNSLPKSSDMLSYSSSDTASPSSAYVSSTMLLSTTSDILSLSSTPTPSSTTPTPAPAPAPAPTCGFSGLMPSTFVAVRQYDYEVVPTFANCKLRCQINPLPATASGPCVIFAVPRPPTYCLLIYPKTGSTYVPTIGGLSKSTSTYAASWYDVGCESEVSTVS